MEPSKKYGKSSFSKHLRNKKSKWTKRMANSKSRLKYKRDLKLAQLIPLTNVKILSTEADQKLFFDTISNPPRPIEPLVKALKKELQSKRKRKEF